MDTLSDREMIEMLLEEIKYLKAQVENLERDFQEHKHTINAHEEDWTR